MYKSYRRYAPFFLVPVLICFVAVFIIPFIMGVVMSFFTGWATKITLSAENFVGFGNYQKAFADPGFQKAFLNTILFSLISIITINFFAFGIALLLTRGKKFTNFFRAIFFMPNLIGGIILGLIWQIIINGVLKSVVGPTVSITDNGWYGFWGLVVLMNWQLIGYMTIIYIASIQNINNDLLEAADVDGAGFFHKLIHVIIPSVMPAFTICLFLTLTNTFKLYDQNYALTRGLPINLETFNYESSLIALDIVNNFNLKSPKTTWYPIAQAKAVIFFVLIGIISGLQVFFTRRKEIEA